MTEEEMLIRARKAVAFAAAIPLDVIADSNLGVLAVLHALRNLNKPVELPRPADEAAAYAIYKEKWGHCAVSWANRRSSGVYLELLATVRAGIALAKEGKV